jgi:hypothetical protein
VKRIARVVGVSLGVLGIAACAAFADSGVAPAERSLASALVLPVSVTSTGEFAAAEPGGSGLPSGIAEWSDPRGTTASLLRRRGKPTATESAHTRPPVVLSPERAAVLLRSLTVPGWGQLSTGHRTAAAVFGVAELGVWTTYSAFRVQTTLRRDAYFRTAKVLAGIDLKGRDEEFLRIVGAFSSSDEYNQLVVARDAANLYYDDPAAFQRYLDAHSLKGADVWAWPSDEALLRYRGQRKDSQRAALRANAALAMAVVNRLMSAIHAARLRPAGEAHTWEMQALPVDGDPTAFRFGVARHF